MLVPDVSKRKLKRFSPEEEGPARWGLPLLFAIFLGVVLGAASERADQIPVLGALTSYLGIWIISTFLVGRISPKRNTAIACGVSYLFAMVFSYYALRTLLGGGDQTLFLALWTVVALTVGPLLSIAGNGTRAPGRKRLWSICLVAGILLGEAVSVMLFRETPERWIVVLFDTFSAVCVFNLAYGRKEKKKLLLLLVPSVLIGMLIFQGPSLLSPVFELIFW